MMYSADYLVLSVLQYYAEKAIEDDNILDDIFCWVRIPMIQRVLPEDINTYVENIKKLIKNKEIDYTLVYPEKQENNNYVYIYSSGRNSENFLDDYGRKTTQTTQMSEKPITSVKTLDNEIDSKTKVDRGSVIVNQYCPSWFANVVDLVDYGEHSEKDYDTLILDKNVPLTSSGQYLQHGYSVRQKADVEVSENNASIDDVTMSVNLVTSGNYVQHYLVAQFFRYLIKMSRKVLDGNGFQVAVSSYSEAKARGNRNAMQFVTTFSLQGKCTDEWIYKSEMAPKCIDFTVSATRDFTDETTVEVSDGILDL